MHYESPAAKAARVAEAEAASAQLVAAARAGRVEIIHRTTAGTVPEFVIMAAGRVVGRCTDLAEAEAMRRAVFRMADGAGMAADGRQLVDANPVRPADGSRPVFGPYACGHCGRGRTACGQRHLWRWPNRPGLFCSAECRDKAARPAQLVESSCSMESAR